MRIGKLNFKKNKKLIIFFCFAVAIFILGIVSIGLEAQPSSIEEAVNVEQLIDEAVGTAQVIPNLNNPTLLPNQMIDTLGQYKVILVGEMHYVEEHQIFMGALLEGLHRKGVRYYLQEIGPAIGHMVDLYITGQISELMPQQIKMDETLIQALASFNKRLRENGQSREQIRYIGFDMNHWGIEYKWALDQLGVLYEHEGLKDYSSRLKGLSSASPEYLNEIEVFINTLNEKVGYADLSSEAITSLLVLSETELASSKIRKQWDDSAREDFIYSEVRRAIDSAEENEKIVVNSGMWHAQLTNMWNMGVKWLGMRLREDFENDDKGFYSFSTSAYKGVRKNRFNSSSRSTFELLDKDQRALLPALRAFHGDVSVFLDFKTLPSLEEAIIIDYPSEQTRVPLNKHFNGLLVYPEINVSKGSVYFE